MFLWRKFIGSKEKDEEIIAKMESFIEEQGKLEVEKIEKETEEQCQLDKATLVTQGVQDLNCEYEKKEKMLKFRLSGYERQLKRQSHMEVITKKAEQMERVKELAWLKLLKSLTEPLVYPKIFLNILAAGMCKMNESRIFIRIREADTDIVQTYLSHALTEYEIESGRKCKVNIHSEWLSPDCAGGAEFLSVNEKIWYRLTLETQFAAILEKNQAEFVTLLFGLRKEHYTSQLRK
ncbi:hypothetical protein OTU49_004219 [Cherax quadricarinatus]|uniref:Uncharacterized protein n=2 Tax=Cherax quadricarinatus TaxID=27406 RepID=A0AAW0XDX4_CHEQU|nr:V-type proton ATPase subunit E-like isoform X1 [Cherax quadricarinatus]